jgi:hypothetical protein
MFRNWRESGLYEFPLQGESRGAGNGEDINGNQCIQTLIKTLSISKGKPSTRLTRQQFLLLSPHSRIFTTIKHYGILLNERFIWRLVRFGRCFFCLSGHGGRHAVGQLLSDSLDLKFLRSYILDFMASRTLSYLQ